MLRPKHGHRARACQVHSARRAAENKKVRETRRLRKQTRRRSAPPEVGELSAALLRKELRLRRFLDWRKRGNTKVCVARRGGRIVKMERWDRQGDIFDYHITTLLPQRPTPAMAASRYAPAVPRSTMLPYTMPTPTNFTPQHRYTAPPFTSLLLTRHTLPRMQTSRNNGGTYFTKRQPSITCSASHESP